MVNNPVDLYRLQPGAPEIHLGDINWNVKLLRRMLAYADAAPADWADYSIPVSDNFDTELLGYLKRFQEEHGLATTDTVEQTTWEALATAGEEAHATGNGWTATTVDRGNVAARIVEVAKAAEARNIREHGTNRGATVEMIQAHAGAGNQAPWCMAFAWTVVDLAYFLEQEFPPELNTWQKINCQQLYEWGRSNDTLLQPEDVLPGDLAILRRADGSHFHVGVCITTPDDSGRFNTIEGNTNTAGSAEGDGIYGKQRNATSCSFVRL